MDIMTRVINLSEVRAYCRRVCRDRTGQKNRDDEAEKLCDIINQYMGMTTYVDRCQEKPWFDEHEANSIIYCNKEAENIFFLKDLPTLHKSLFAYTKHSLLKNQDSEIYSVSLENFGLVKDNNKLPAFKLINPETVYKKTRD